MEVAKRIAAIPPYLFAGIEEKIAAAKAAGADIISLGIGDPDLATPGPIVEALAQAAQDPANHQYPSSQGMLAFRQSVADYYGWRFGVTKLDPKSEICALIGSKEGIANINYCFVDPGDVNLIPDPGYPVYSTATRLAGGECCYLPLLPEQGFLPDLDAVPGAMADKARILWLNYPNNPTGAVTDLGFFERAVAFARKHDLLICHDNSYGEVTYDGYVAPSILQVPGAKDVAVEFGSCSKTFNMTGWRMGYVVGNAKAVKALATYKSNVDSGAFQAVQVAGMAGFRQLAEFTAANNQVYAARRDILVGGLNAMGWQLSLPKATFYVWAPVPQGYTSGSFAEYVFEQTQVVITPGSGYGPAGEGWFRAALTAPEARMREAIGRMQAMLGQVSF